MRNLKFKIFALFILFIYLFDFIIEIKGAEAEDDTDDIDETEENILHSVDFNNLVVAEIEALTNNIYERSLCSELILKELFLYILAIIKFSFLINKGETLSDFLILKV